MFLVFLRFSVETNFVCMLLSFALPPTGTDRDLFPSFSLQSKTFPVAASEGAFLNILLTIFLKTHRWSNKQLAVQWLSCDDDWV